MRAPIIVAGALALCACAPKAPSPTELQTMQSAPQPSSTEAAQAAVRAYFETKLLDAPSARWLFAFPPIQGKATVGAMREFGWFMCGQVNSKNRMGGYGGYRPFFAYFSPTTPDRVQDGTIGDTDETQRVIEDWCKGLYGRPPG